ncbi:MAG: ureidoglycolate lyase [Gammaproteobacteria bacterium]|nr:ureidoglycolate lyase [Gammaproteobacteria bacterium]MDH3536154.1 ureidoglycolate lyase [Gammaproteobacteria bacterium]
MYQPTAPIDYLSPDVPGQLPWHDVPLVIADDRSVEGFGCLVDDADGFDIEIVQWPALGWRPVDAGTGDEAGTVEGVFHSEWCGQVLRARNDAVNGDYVLGWSTNPAEASEDEAAPDPVRVLLWHLNYHPDGGQLFYPLDSKPFVVPVAMPGDDIALDDIVALWCDGSRGLYIRPGIWHEGVFPSTRAQSFRDRQGRVHARVSCNIAREFGLFLNVPLRPATS